MSRLRRAVRPALAGVGGLALAVGLVLTLLRLAGGDARQLAIGQAFAPWAIPAYVVAVVLGAVLVARPGDVLGRRVVSPAAAVGVVGLLLHGWWVVPLYTGGTPAPASGADALTVMTSNLRLGLADPSDVVETAEEHAVDVLVVQEVTPLALRGLEDAGIDDLYPHRAGAAGPGATGTIAFSRTPVDDEVAIDTRAGTVAFETAGLSVVGVHPAYPLSEAWSADLALLRDVLAATDPDLVLGDFNASLDHAPLRAILDTGLRDAAELANAGWQPTWPANGFDGLPLPGTLPLPTSVAIDHVLVGPALTATRTETTVIDGTDHLALIAQVAPV